jgi:hypothetical protein
MREFIEIVETTDSAQDAFQDKLYVDRHMNGFLGQGTIAQKSGFKKKRPLPLVMAKQVAQDDVDACSPKDVNARCIPFYKGNVSVIKERVCAKDQHLAEIRALKRTDFFHKERPENWTVQSRLVRKGYTAKLDKSESYDKKRVVTVSCDNPNANTEIPVSAEVADKLPPQGVEGDVWMGPEGVYESTEKARSAIMTHFALAPTSKYSYTVEETKQRVDKTTYSQREVASEVPTFEVVIHHVEDDTAPETFDGYIFYGKVH